MYCEVLTLEEALQKVEKYLKMNYSVTVSFLNGVYCVRGM